MIGKFMPLDKVPDVFYMDTYGGSNGNREPYKAFFFAYKMQPATKEGIIDIIENSVNKVSTSSTFIPKDRIEENLLWLRFMLTTEYFFPAKDQLEYGLEFTHAEIFSDERQLVEEHGIQSCLEGFVRKVDLDSIAAKCVQSWKSENVMLKYGAFPASYLEDIGQPRWKDMKQYDELVIPTKYGRFAITKLPVNSNRVLPKQRASKVMGSKGLSKISMDLFYSIHGNRAAKVPDRSYWIEKTLAEIGTEIIIDLYYTKIGCKCFPITSEKGNSQTKY
jgi:hypothetical protein